jgi:hypothetical protein
MSDIEIDDSNLKLNGNDENKIETTTTTIIINNNDEKSVEDDKNNNNRNSVDLDDNFIVKAKKKVTFPDDERIIKGYSDPPKRWIPG